MAKKSEARFADYMKLIAALDALPESRGDSGASLDALIADDDDGPVDALIADDDDDDIGLAPVDGDPPRIARPLPTLVGPSGGKPDRTSPSPARETEPAEVSLAMLAGIEDEDDGPPVRGRARPSSPARVADDDIFTDLLEEAQRQRPAHPRRTCAESLSYFTSGSTSARGDRYGPIGIAVISLGFGVHPAATRLRDEGRSDRTCFR